jgi:3-oxo-5-alpha-steroid 4-dehydrogenase 1
MAGLFVCLHVAPVPNLPHQKADRYLLTAGGCQCIHYINRAILSPLFLNPSMSPIHLLVWTSALAFQIINAISIGGWLAGYGPTAESDWEGRSLYIKLGAIIWIVGFVGNIYHDDVLREIRRAVIRKRKGEEQAKGGGKQESKTAEKVYMLPHGGLFEQILYPHFLCEWVEWAGYWIIGGWRCLPARCFLLNEVSTMLPRALQGKRWYIQRFGKDKIGQRKAVIPGLI